MAQPLLRAEIEIDATPAEVWTLVSDLRQMPRWSPQCRYTRVLGRARKGAWAVNINRRGRLFWPTTSVITDYDTEKRIAFRITENTTEWAYELSPTPGGTLLVETRRADNGVSRISTTMVNALLGGEPSFEGELVEGMQQSLTRIKAAAEQA